MAHLAPEPLAPAQAPPHTARVVVQSVEHARRWGARRLALLTLWDLSVGLAALGLLCGLLSAVSLRGDWAALLAALGTLAVTATFVYRARVRGRARFRDRFATARLIARTDGSLGAATGAVAARLRREVQSAIELDGQLTDSRPKQQWRGHLGSASLAEAYVRDAGDRLDASGATKREMLPRPARAPRLLLTTLVVVAAISAGRSSDWKTGLMLMIAMEDGRPPPPPVPVWSSLELSFRYPEHTGRPDRLIPNPSGALRAPAGTVVSVDMELLEPATTVRIILIPDPVQRFDSEAKESPAAIEIDDTKVPSSAPEVIELEQHGNVGAGRWRGDFPIRSSGSWMAVAVDDPRFENDHPSARRSVTLPLVLEADAPPEVELLPLPKRQQQVAETDRVEVRFTARDDFGLVGAELVYQMPDGKISRLPAGEAAMGERLWRHRYDWDLSTIPIDQRSEVSYWIEVRDNDPGLGLLPLPNPPGKVTASGKQRLLVRDTEFEHAANIESLRTIRDTAVDLLAFRLTTLDLAPADETASRLARLQRARELHRAGESLLVMIAQAVDALSVDTLVRERDVATLAGIHKRLLELHDAETKLHEALPPGGEVRRPEAINPLLRGVGRHNTKQIQQLEDEVIRLDDLVDLQIVARLEQLMARVQAAQQKLVELLERLQAGDESVRGQIEQLQQRIKDDLRRVSQARSKLRKELGNEFVNLDAFERLERQMAAEDTLERLRQGDVDGALNQAKQRLEEMQKLRDAVQQKAGEQGPEARLSPEEQARMKMLRELSRLQDEEGGLREQTRGPLEAWRNAVADVEAEDPADTAKQAKKMRETLEEINDARLSRDARVAYEDAREALESLEKQASGSDSAPVRALPLTDSALKAREALERAVRGSKKSEAEGKALRQLRQQMRRLEDDLAGPLPLPREALSPEERQTLDALAEKQDALRKRAAELARSPHAEVLPPEGARALEDTDRAMRSATSDLRETSPRPALGGQKAAWSGLQRAIDSLRRTSPPPSARDSADEASTEAEQDRSLRDEVVDAMKEGRSVEGSVERYYEELLR